MFALPRQIASHPLEVPVLHAAGRVDDDSRIAGTSALRVSVVIPAMNEARNYFDRTNALHYAKTIAIDASVELQSTRYSQFLHSLKDESTETGSDFDSRISLMSKVFHDFPIDEMFLDNALQNFGSARVIPDSFGIDDGDGALCADAQAIGFGAKDSAPLR